MPVDWSMFVSAFEFMPQFGLSIMLGCLVMDVSVIRKESDIPVITISQLLLLFWLFLLGFLVDWIRKDQVKVKKKTRSRRQKSRRFRRKKLPSALVIPCRTCRNTPQDRQQCRWRRKQRKLRTRVKKRRQLHQRKLLKMCCASRNVNSFIRGSC